MSITAMKHERYAVGYTDCRGIYGDPDVKWEPIKVSWWAKDWAMFVAYFMFFVGVSMALAPMAWVLFFQWVFA
jgi:hypothetical protein